MKIFLICTVVIILASCMGTDKMQERVEKILSISFPSYFQNKHFTIERAMGLILLVKGEIPSDKLEDFIERFNLQASDLNQVNDLPINFNAYNDAEWWTLETAKKDLYVSRSGDKGKWKAEHHFHFNKNEETGKYVVRLLYFEER
jgi:hypothetical protein